MLMPMPMPIPMPMPVGSIRRIAGGSGLMNDETGGQLSISYFTRCNDPRGIEAG